MPLTSLQSQLRRALCSAFQRGLREEGHLVGAGFLDASGFTSVTNLITRALRAAQTMAAASADGRYS